MNSHLNMIFTPIDELPMPPTWMLEELEEEFKNYNTFLMAQIFTMKEAAPIRNAIREKINRTPSAKALHEAFGKRIERTNKGDIDDCSLNVNEVDIIRIKPHFCYTINCEENDDFTDAISYKKKKGVKPGMWKLAEKLHKVWNYRIAFYRNYRQKHTDELIACGFNKWLIHNLKKCEKKKNNKNLYYCETEIPK